MELWDRGEGRPCPPVAQGADGVLTALISSVTAPSSDQYSQEGGESP